jgi:hypothetical protein
VWSTVLPTVVALVGACLWVRRRTRVADLLGAGAAASLAFVYFSRASTMTYWWLPGTLLSLVAVAGPGPRRSEVAGAIDGPVTRELAVLPTPAAGMAVLERISRPAR